MVLHSIFVKVERKAIRMTSYAAILLVITLAIMGGADGSISVIIGVSGSEKKIHAACSALTFEPQNKVEWKMTFREKTVEDFFKKMYERREKGCRKAPYKLTHTLYC